MDIASPDPAAALRRAGLRVTASRLAVLGALYVSAPHASVDAVVSAVRERLGDTSAQTVYNVLRTLIEVGLVRRLEPAGRPGLYELRVGDNHHHAVCRRCGTITDIDCAVGDAPCLTAAAGSGYEIDEAEVIYWGRCPECVASASVSSGEFERTRGVRQALGLEQPRSRATSHLNEPSKGNNQRGERTT